MAAAIVPFLALTATEGLAAVNGPAGAPASAARAVMSTGAPLAASVHGLGLTIPATRLSARTGLLALARVPATSGAVHRLAVGAVAFPAVVDLSAYAVAPSNQGQLNACVAFSEGYTLAGWESNYQHHAGTPFAPMYLYNQINGGKNGPTRFMDGFQVLQSKGALEAAYWTHPATDYVSAPNATMYAHATAHKIGTVTRLFTGDKQGAYAQTTIQTALATKQPVELGIPVYYNFNYLNATTKQTMTAAMATGTMLGYHAIVALGYNSTGVQIENSWGTGWGKGGWATLSWDFINRYAVEAYVTTGFVNTTPTTGPAVTRLSKPAVNVVGGDSLTVSAAPLDTTSPITVRLVNTANATNTANALVTTKSTTTLTVTVPALTAGTYRVVITGSAGVGVPSTTGADTVIALKPFPAVLANGAVARTNGGSKITLLGTGFGTTAALFTAKKITAVTAAGTTLPLTWTDDSHLSVTMPVGVSGVPLQISLVTNGVAGTGVAVPYLPPVPVITAVGRKKVSLGGTSPGTHGHRSGHRHA